jgi:hypothetical protein
VLHEHWQYWTGKTWGCTCSSPQSAANHQEGSYTPFKFRGLLNPYEQLYDLFQDGVSITEEPAPLKGIFATIRRLTVFNEHLQPYTIDPVDFRRVRFTETNELGCHPFPTFEKAR